jgi:hypothetical protein
VWIAVGDYMDRRFEGKGRTEAPRLAVGVNRRAITGTIRRPTPSESDARLGACEERVCQIDNCPYLSLKGGMRPKLFVISII